MIKNKEDKDQESRKFEKLENMKPKQRASTNPAKTTNETQI